MYKILIVTLSLTVSIASLQARSVRAIFLSPPKNAPKSAFLYTGSESLEVPLPTRNLSTSVKLPKGALTMAVLPNPLAEDAEVPKEAQIVKIPEQWTNCIMVFLPNAKNKIFPASVVVIDGSNAKFPLGETMIYNLTDQLFLGKFGSKSLTIRAWKSDKIKTKAQAGKRFYPVAIDCVAADTQKRTALTRTNWIHYPEARQILFVTQLADQKVPRVWGVLDHTKEAEKEE